MFSTITSFNMYRNETSGDSSFGLNVYHASNSVNYLNDPLKLLV